MSFREWLRVVAAFSTFGVCLSHGGQDSEKRFIAEGGRNPAAATGIGFAPVDGIGAGGPGILFGWKGAPNGLPELAHIILLKTSQQPKSFKHNRTEQRRLTAGGGFAETDYIMFGKRVTLKTSVEWDAKQTRIASEKLVLGGKEIELEKGRVFFLDLTAESPIYKQTNMALPKVKVPPLPGDAEVERFSKALLRALQADPQVKEWLR